jgi:hypothetical protein
MVDTHHKHPSQYTRGELEQMLRVERLGVTQQFLALKREIRERAERLEELERRLRKISRVEDLVADGQLGRRKANVPGRGRIRASFGYASWLLTRCRSRTAAGPASTRHDAASGGCKNHRVTGYWRSGRIPNLRYSFNGSACLSAGLPESVRIRPWLRATGRGRWRVGPRQRRVRKGPVAG